MVTVKFETGKLNSEFVVLPTIMVVTDSKKNNIGICFSWLKGLLTVGINWTTKVAKIKAQ